MPLAVVSIPWREACTPARTDTVTSGSTTTFTSGGGGGVGGVVHPLPKPNDNHTSTKDRLCITRPLSRHGRQQQQQRRYWWWWWWGRIPPHGSPRGSAGIEGAITPLCLVPDHYPSSSSCRRQRVEPERWTRRPEATRRRWWRSVRGGIQPTPGGSASDTPTVSS